MSELYIGIDAGGTSTVGVSATREGYACALATGGPANLQVEGFDPCLETIRAVVRKLTEPSSRLRCVGAGVAGARTPSDQDRLASMVADSLDCEVVIRGDIEVACLASFPHGKGITVVAGTGSSAMAIAGGSVIARAGGWGSLLGDEGSAYWIGLEALRAVTRALDGYGPQTALCDAIRRAFAICSFDHLARIAMDKKRDEIAALSKLVHEKARAGDSVAVDILQRAGRELGLIAGAVAKGIGDDVRISLVGGVFASGDFIAKPLLGTLRGKGIRAKIVKANFPPCVGGLVLAFRSCGIEPSGSILSNLGRSMPSYVKGAGVSGRTRRKT